jgi:hypothetical protein
MDWMTARITKPKCLLLDANIVIVAYELSVWLKLVEQCHIMVPSIVVHDEAKFYSRELGGIHEDINLSKLVQEGKISELAATDKELADLYAVFDNVFIEGIDPGEAEALALLRAGKAAEAHFCTGDASAIKALAMLGISEHGISLETLLAKFGLQKRLRVQYTEQFFNEHIERGRENRLTGQGLAGEGLLNQVKKRRIEE